MSESNRYTADEAPTPKGDDMLNPVVDTPAQQRARCNARLERIEQADTTVREAQQTRILAQRSTAALQEIISRLSKRSVIDLAAIMSEGFDGKNE